MEAFYQELLSKRIAAGNNIPCLDIPKNKRFVGRLNFSQSVNVGEIVTGVYIDGVGGLDTPRAIKSDMSLVLPPGSRIFLPGEGEAIQLTGYLEDDNSGFAMIGGPGPNTLRAGDLFCGFFGELPDSELIQTPTFVGDTGGLYVSEDDTKSWFKFAYRGKILYTQKRACIRGRDGSLGLNRFVHIAGQKYLVRWMSAGGQLANNTGLATSRSYIVERAEREDLLYPLIGGGTMDHPWDMRYNYQTLFFTASIGDELFHPTGIDGEAPAGQYRFRPVLELIQD